MVSKFKSVSYILIAFILTACASNSKMLKNSAEIKAGMTSEELESLMGPPQNRQFLGKREAWQYCSTGFDTDHYVIAWLYNDVVAGMQTYTGGLMGSCTKHFRQVDWQ